MDSNVLRDFFSVQTAAWTGVSLLFLFVIRMWNGSPAMFAQWIEYRKAKAAEKAADWLRLREEIGRLDDRCIKLETSEAKCRDDLAAAKERIATLEGYQVGIGHARQEVTILEADKRLKP